MPNEEALYAAVAEELQRGEIRQGLWAKALSEADYDEQRAKARYIKLRVKALHRELAEGIYEAQLREKDDAKLQKELAYQTRIQDLDWRSTGLVQLQRARTRIRALGFWLCFLAGGVAAFVFLGEDNASAIERLGSSAVLGLCAGAAGFVMAELVRWLLPSQWHVSREEAAIKSEREGLERAQMSPVARALTNFVEFVIGAAFVCYLIYVAIKHFAK